MPLWSRLNSLARNLLRKPAVESELEDELQAYAAQLADEKIAAGMSHIGSTSHCPRRARRHRAGQTIGA